MDKKNFIGIIILGCLFAIFAIVSVLLFLTKNRSPFLTAGKMKIGAIILGLTAIAGKCNNDPVVMCYDTVATDQVIISDSNNYYVDTIRLNLADQMNISGKIDMRMSEKYSFKLSDMESNKVFEDDLQAKDGVFDKNVEEFNITLPNLQPGKYNLEFYPFGKDEVVENKYANAFYPVVICNQKKRQY